MSKTLVREIKPYIELHMDRVTGIAWIENGSTGNGHSAHPNIDVSGSVKGMKDMGYWRKEDIVVKSHGYYYNVSRTSISDELDEIAKENCRCIGCRG